MIISHAELLYYLRYNKCTGQFQWRRTVKHKHKGKPAGRRDTLGYIEISFRGKRYKGHRLAWFYMTGSMPKEDVEHKNLIKHDNKWKNLRLTDDFLNQANTRLRKNNTSGFKGVTKRSNGRWRVRVGSHNKQFHLGDFDDPT